jgi:hypothetical protein
MISRIARRLLPRSVFSTISRSKLELRSKISVARIGISQWLAPVEPLSELSAQILKDLRRYGHARISSPEFLKLADYAAAEYLVGVTSQKKLHLRSTLDLSGNSQYLLSFNDANLHKFFFNEDIHAALRSYAGRLFFRESPLLEDFTYNGSDEVTRDVRTYAAAFHTDYFRQFNLMLLLSDIPENNTCTEYAQGSNNRNVFIEGGKVDYPRSNQLIEDRGYQVVKLTGRRGDVVLMDTTGFHRACLKIGTTRQLLTTILNPGFPFIGYGESVEKPAGIAAHTIK